ncbi:unnamed protein product [Closterium sp. NIES-64]|nr:unnamed protein product [Closterium sp. NIES-64]
MHLDLTHPSGHMGSLPPHPSFWTHGIPSTLPILLDTWDPFHLTHPSGHMGSLPPYPSFWTHGIPSTSPILLDTWDPFHLTRHPLPTPLVQREVIVLGRLSHPHLVHLHGYCMEGNEALLVYEFMTGSSLDKALLDSEWGAWPVEWGATGGASGELTLTWNMLLKVVVQVATEALAPCRASGELVFSWSMRLKVAVQVAAEAYMHLGDEVTSESTQRTSGELFFSWSMRLKVAVQVAEALAFLHGANFIHRDLKASNVLLSPEYDAKLTGFGMEYDAKLTDFGMVRVGPDRQLQSIVSTRIMGTRGYTDPSYMETGHLGAKSDVYSFGVLLLELVTGRRVVDEGGKNGQSSAEHASPTSHVKPRNTSIRILVTSTRSGAPEAWRLWLGHCVADDRRTRPEIGAVLEKLKLLVRACESDEGRGSS